jgi:uncharacterized RDD family membrane protein YckC
MNLNIAGIWRRIFGGVVDLVLIFMVLFYFIKTFGQQLPDGTYHLSGFPMVFIMLIVFLYYAVLEATTGKTIGKYVVRTRVVNAEGLKISWKQAIVRTLMRVIDGFFLYLVAFIAIISSEHRQRLGDMVAKTYVIKQ